MPKRLLLLAVEGRLDDVAAERPERREHCIRVRFLDDEEQRRPAGCDRRLQLVDKVPADAAVHRRADRGAERAADRNASKGKGERHDPPDRSTDDRRGLGRAADLVLDVGRSVRIAGYDRRVLEVDPARSLETAQRLQRVLRIVEVIERHDDQLVHHATPRRPHRPVEAYADGVVARPWGGRASRAMAQFPASPDERERQPRAITGRALTVASEASRSVHRRASWAAKNTSWTAQWLSAPHGPPPSAHVRLRLSPSTASMTSRRVMLSGDRARR